MSQKDLAFVGGVETNALGHYEAGKRIPKADFLFQLAAVGVDVQYVLLNVHTNLIADALTDDESLLLRRFRDVDRDVKTSILCLLDKAREK